MCNISYKMRIWRIITLILHKKSKVLGAEFCTIFACALCCVLKAWSNYQFLGCCRLAPQAQYTCEKLLIIVKMIIQILGPVFLKWPSLNWQRYIAQKFSEKWGVVGVFGCTNRIITYSSCSFCRWGIGNRFVQQERVLLFHPTSNH